VVGLILMIDLRVLGLFKGIPLGSTRRLLPYLWAGFILNTVSGIGLFVADAERFFFGGPFQLKLLFIASGLVQITVLDLLFLKPAAAAEAGEASPPPSFASKVVGMGLFRLLLLWCLLILMWLVGANLVARESAGSFVSIAGFAVFAIDFAAILWWAWDLRKPRSDGSSSVIAKLLALLLVVMSAANIVALWDMYNDLFPGPAAVIADIVTITALGGISAWMIKLTFFTPASAAAPGGPLPLPARVLAGVSAIYWWLAVILSGRLIAYLM